MTIDCYAGYSFFACSKTAVIRYRRVRAIQLRRTGKTAKDGRRRSGWAEMTRIEIGLFDFGAPSAIVIDI